MIEFESIHKYMLIKDEIIGFYKRVEKIMHLWNAL